jgi:hypothetical protein
MKIKRQKDKIMVEIPFWSKRFNPYMPDMDVGKYPTLTGLIVRNRNYDEMGFAKTIDMDYKDKGDQVGSFVIMWNGGEESFRKTCKELGIGIQEIRIKNGTK